MAVAAAAAERHRAGGGGDGGGGPWAAAGAACAPARGSPQAPVAWCCQSVAYDHFQMGPPLAHRRMDSVDSGQTAAATDAAGRESTAAGAGSGR